MGWWHSKNNPSIDGFSLTVFDLYDVIIDILTSEGCLDQFFEFETIYGLEDSSGIISDLLRLTEEENTIVRYICEHTPSDAIVFLTGVGKCYPILRSHNVLNNLHQSLDRVPVVMFYPGKYDGQALVLFDGIKDDNYYRAFRLVEN